MTGVGVHGRCKPLEVISTIPAFSDHIIGMLKKIGTDADGRTVCDM